MVLVLCYNKSRGSIKKSYRLYVRSCFEQTLAWTAKIGSQDVHDVQGTYARQAQETECY